MRNTNKQLKTLLIGARSLLESIDRHLGTGGTIIDGSVHHSLIKKIIESIETNARLPKGENTTETNDHHPAVYGTSQLAETIVDDIAKLNMSDATFHEKARHVEGLIAGHIKPDTNIEDADLQEAINIIQNVVEQDIRNYWFEAAKSFLNRVKPKPKFGPFSLEKYTPESIVKTVDGRDVRILCTDSSLTYCPIVGIVENGPGNFLSKWAEDGEHGQDKNLNLMLQGQGAGREIIIDLTQQMYTGNYLATVVNGAAPVSEKTKIIKRIKTRV